MSLTCKNTLTAGQPKLVHRWTSTSIVSLSLRIILCTLRKRPITSKDGVCGVFARLLSLHLEVQMGFRPGLQSTHFLGIVMDV